MRPEYHLRIRFRTRSLFRFAQTSFVFATRLKPEARNRIRIRISLRNANYLSFLKFNETLRFYFSLVFQLIIQGVPFGQHTKKGVFGTYRTEA